MDSDRIQLDMESSTCRVPKSPWTGAPFSQKLFFKSVSSSSLHVYTLHVSPGTLAPESQVHSVILLLGLVIGSPCHLCPPLIPNISGSSGSYGSSRRTTELHPTCYRALFSSEPYPRLAASHVTYYMGQSIFPDGDDAVFRM